MKAQYIAADGPGPSRLPGHRRHLPGHHLHHHSVGRVHALCAQQRLVLAGADGRPADDRVVILFRGRLLSRKICISRSGCCRSLLTGLPQSAARLVHRDLHARHQPVHALVRHQARRGDLVSDASRNFPACRPASPICRSRSAARSRRLFVIERLMNAEFLSSRRRPKASARFQPNNATGHRHGRPDPDRQLSRSSACWACRSPMRSALPRFSRRSGSTCRSKRSC